MLNFHLKKGIIFNKNISFEKRSKRLNVNLKTFDLLETHQKYLVEIITRVLRQAAMKLGDHPFSTSAKAFE